MPDYRFAWHATDHADNLNACLDVQPANLGGGLIGPEVARGVWKKLLGHPALLSAVVTSDPAIKGSRIAAFGATLFVSSEFLDSEVANPRPGVNDRLFARFTEDENVILDPEAIGEANSTTGLDVVSLYGSWRADAANEKTLSILPGAFVQLSAGYNIRRLLWEPVGEIERAFARTSGVHRFLAEFPDLNRDLVMLDPQSAARVPASLAQLIFSSRKPRLRLARSDRELLAAALKGMTDNELASKLGVSLSAVKARWRSVFLKFSEALPGLIENITNDPVRGPQKRHLVLDYVRAHPEEVRPWSDSKANVAGISSDE